jgi:hypothetical protein
MDSDTIARLAASARVAIGAALLAAPGPVAKRWLGEISERPEAQVAVAGLGARDLVLGLGTLWSLGGRKRDPRPWLVGSGLADTADLLSAGRFRTGLSTPSLLATAALAGGSAALHAWLQSELG